MLVHSEQRLYFWVAAIIYGDTLVGTWRQTYGPAVRNVTACFLQRRSRNGNAINNFGRRFTGAWNAHFDSHSSRNKILALHIVSLCQHHCFLNWIQTVRSDGFCAALVSINMIASFVIHYTQLKHNSWWSHVLMGTRYWVQEKNKLGHERTNQFIQSIMSAAATILLSLFCIFIMQTNDINLTWILIRVVAHVVK